MLSPAFACVQRAGWQRWLGRGVSADDYAPAVEIPCRIELSLRREGDSSVQTASGTGFFPPGSPISPGDRLLFDGKRLYVAEVRRICGLSGRENHLEAELT